MDMAFRTDFRLQIRRSPERRWFVCSNFVSPHMILSTFFRLQGDVEQLEPGAGASTTAVLGSSMMAEIHAELPLTELPSWINPVPRNVGTTSRGKLSADQWHILCVVNLPIILIPKWAPKGGRFAAMLENFMHLVTEVVVGSLLEMSEEAISLYETSALAYLKTAQKLYGISLTPNQHNSLHIPFFLRLFGPLHSIRTFFSERMNYLLQQQNTNLKFGKFRRCRTCFQPG